MMPSKLTPIQSFVVMTVCAAVVTLGVSVSSKLDTNTDKTVGAIERAACLQVCGERGVLSCHDNRVTCERSNEPY